MSSQYNVIKQILQCSVFHNPDEISQYYVKLLERTKQAKSQGHHGLALVLLSQSLVWKINRSLCSLQCSRFAIHSSLWTVHIIWYLHFRFLFPSFTLCLFLVTISFSHHHSQCLTVASCFRLLMTRLFQAGTSFYSTQYV